MGGSPVRLLQNSTGEGELGSRQWGSGLLLAAFLELRAADYANRRVCEIGCGLGLPSLVLARVCDTVHVVLTDKAELKPLVEHNIARNFDAKKIAEPRMPKFRPLLWGSEVTDSDVLQCDTYVGADLTYELETLPLLLQTLRALCTSANKLFVLAYSKERVSESECDVNHTH
jgi:predicted nicotinamide N-methyase